MFIFPDTEKKLRSRISSYKSTLNKEKKRYGYINDGSGKRFLLFCLYFVLNDLEKSKNYFGWYKKEFPDDSGEPIQKLCWAISLYRMGKEFEAKYMLAKSMLSNLYMIPYIIGEAIQEYDIWHSSNFKQIDYVKNTPKEVRKNIEQNEIQWIKKLYQSFEFRRIRKRYIEIYHELQNTKEIESRRVLLSESYSLLEILQKKTS